MGVKTSQILAYDFGLAFFKAYLFSLDNLELYQKRISPNFPDGSESAISYLKEGLPSSEKVKIASSSSLEDFSFLENPNYKVFKVSDSLNDLEEVLKVKTIDLGAHIYSKKILPDEILNFAISKISSVEVQDYFANKKLHLYTIPRTKFQLELELALAKAYLSHRLKDDFPKIVLTGGVFSNYKKFQDLLFGVLDASQAKFSEVFIDEQGICSVLGAAISSFKNKKNEILKLLKLKKLATIVNLRSGGEAKVDLGLKESQKISLGEDDLVSVPLKGDEEVRVHVSYPTKFSFETTGSLFGLIFDGREKPLNLRSAKYKKKILEWYEQVVPSF